MSTSASLSSRPDVPDARAATYWIVSQVKSNRVVYFTDDPDYTPPIQDDWYYVSSFQGELPKAMTLKNCWRWRFNGGVFKDAGLGPAAKPAAERLLEHNRKALLKILREKVDTVRGQYAAVARMGFQVREDKLREAEDYLAGSRDRAYPFLESMAAARDVTLADAARLVVERAAATRTMLIETEQIRERFKVAIHEAQTPEQLQAIREQLMGAVYPRLADRFAHRFVRITPPDRHAPLSDAVLAHERVRLRTQLRNTINALRERHAPGYAFDERVRARKVAAARAAQSGDPLLEGCARERGLTLEQAAQQILQEETQTEHMLVETELLKEAVLAEISRARTEHDLHLVSMKLKSAQGAGPAQAGT
jgi:hypothetical protein